MSGRKLLCCAISRKHFLLHKLELQNTVHLSICYSSSLAGSFIPSHRAKVRYTQIKWPLHPSTDIQRQKTIQVTGNLEKPINLISLACFGLWKKDGVPRENSTNTGRKCKHHTEKPVKTQESKPEYLAGRQVPTTALQPRPLQKSLVTCTANGLLA